MATFKSRSKRLIISGGPKGPIDFGKDLPEGEYTTTDPAELSFLRGHRRFGVAFFESEIPVATSPGSIAVDDTETAVKYLTDAFTV